jgi:hypothetical protein
VHFPSFKAATPVALPSDHLDKIWLGIIAAWVARTIAPAVLDIHDAIAIDVFFGVRLAIAGRLSCLVRATRFVRSSKCAT